MSETPRTERICALNPLPDVVSAAWARQLERELNAANERAKRLEEAGDKMHWAFMHPFDTAHESVPDAWIKAKEAKP